jgi:hypothetical protein
LKLGILAALVLTASTVLASDRSPDGVALNFSGESAVTVQPIEANGQVWLEVRLVIGSNMPTEDNGFGAHAVVLAHNYFRLTVEESQALAEGLRTWLSVPHSDTVFRVPGYETGIGISFTGNAWSAELTKVVIVNIQVWLQQERGHLHGGNYAVVTLAQAQTLLAALDAWLEKPEAGDPIYTSSIY